eukprot:symbB.v1.2.018355.t1/scaffold1457.1/size117646/13
MARYRLPRCQEVRLKSQAWRSFWFPTRRRSCQIQWNAVGSASAFGGEEFKLLCRKPWKRMSVAAVSDRKLMKPG